MPAVGKNDDKGDLYARIEAQLPTTVSDRDREHWEALAKGEAAKKNSAA